ncbi:MAG: hypothetical protein GX564_08745 [Oligosphaeraceae bacterium]|nr:hypothetical protein [Oligosphaeraceae bacterium]
MTVYYFHNNIRCLTCNKFERLTKEVLETSFAPQLAAGSLVFKPVNTDAKENAHFVKTYALTSKSVVLQRGDKHVNLDQIWTIIGQSDADFKSYIAKGITDFLADIPKTQDATTTATTW